MDEKYTKGSLWKYQGNYVIVIERNGVLIRVRDEHETSPNFLINPEKLVAVTVEEFRNWIRRRS